MTWKNDSDAYELKAVYGSIEDQIKSASQKYTAKHMESAVAQTKAFVNTLPAGEYSFSYPLAIVPVVQNDTRLTFVRYDALLDVLTISKE